jgi:hypothetical protein
MMAAVGEEEESRLAIDSGGLDLAFLFWPRQAAG